MKLQFPADRPPIPAAGRPARAARGDPAAARVAWMLACAQRLRELRPRDDPASLASTAAQLWVEVGRFDPLIAAEMEHESWF